MEKPFAIVLDAYSLCAGPSDFRVVAKEYSVFPVSVMIRLFAFIKRELH